MKGSPIFPGLDNDNNYEFDPTTDFSEFLEEARRYANTNVSHEKEYPSVENAQKHEVIINKQEKKKSKKLWKNVLFPFWRSSSSDKKAKQHLTQTTAVNSHAKTSKQRAHVSGPVFGHNGVATAAPSGRIRHRISASGPLASLFQPKRRDENEIPYVSLDRLNKPPYDAKVYGPVYLVS